jgi:hypothetical protein
LNAHHRQVVALLGFAHELMNGLGQSVGEEQDSGA